MKELFRVVYPREDSLVPAPLTFGARHRQMIRFNLTAKNEAARALKMSPGRYGSAPTKKAFLMPIPVTSAS